MATDIDVAVVGAGVAGLATAYRLQAMGRSPRVFEATGQVGGRMRTTHQDGYVVDEGTETLAQYGYPSTWALVRALGLTAEVLPVTSSVGVWRDGRVHPHVAHPMSGITGSGLSPRGRLAMTRMATAVLRRARRFDVLRPGDSPLGTQTVADFADRYGAELRDFMLQPAVGTAFGWRPERSCVAPLIATMLATRGIFHWRSYRGGMATLPLRLAAETSVDLGRPVAEVKQGQRGVHVAFESGDAVTARSAVLAVPAPVALELHPSRPTDETSYLRACSFTPMIRVTCLLDRPLEPARGRLSPPVYAVLIPAREDAVLGGLTVEHRKAPDRAPAGAGLVTLLPAAATTPELLDRDDDEIVRPLLERAERYVPGIGAACRHAAVHRFRYGLPEATPAAVARSSAFLDRPAREIDYAGDWIFQRPTSESAVRSSETVVARLAAVAG